MCDSHLDCQTRVSPHSTIFPAGRNTWGHHLSVQVHAPNVPEGREKNFEPTHMGLATYRCNRLLTYIDLHNVPQWGVLQMMLFINRLPQQQDSETNT